MAKSWRECAAPRCVGPAVHGAWCVEHQREPEPDHLAFIDWNDPCEVES